MASLLSRISTAAFRRRRLVLALWLAAAAAAIAGMAAFGGAGKINQAFTVPGSQSQQALDRMKQQFPAASGTSAQIVFTAPAGGSVTSPASEQAIAAVLDAAAKAPKVVAVLSPFSTGAVSPRHTAAIAQVEYQVTGSDLKTATLDALTSAAQQAPHGDLGVAVGGPAFGNTAANPGAEDLIGVLVAVLVLALTFGSLLAAGMPLLTALFGIVVAVAGILALTGAVDISSTALTLALMIGLAVGIDYALFIVTRHRAQLARGSAPEESAGLALGTAGSAVLFAGLTVVIAMAGLSVVGIPFLTVMGLCAAGAVFIAVAVALTLLPAILGFAGQRLTPKPGSRTARREAAAEGSQHAATTSDGAGTKPRGAERWVRLATRRPLITVLIVIAGLALLAWPARGMNLALPDNGTAPVGSSQRVAYDEVSAQFGPGFNGPLLILADTSRSARPAAAAQQIARQLAALPDVAAVTAPQSSAGATAALIELIPKSAPSAQATKDLVTTIRGEAASWRQATGASIAVTGTTAVGIDVSSKLSSAMLPFAIVVVGLSLILLLLVFRSLIVPVKAAAGFLLSVSASFGLVVGLFQQGRLDRLIGVDTTGPITSFLPIILMAVLFGLAMDYEVFLVSRMREDYVHHGDARAAVHAGARSAGRVVTAAALIMFSVFASFVTSDSMILKQIAFALAVGVLIDAFLVRMTLVPAVLTLTGRAAWWLPRRLARILPNLDIEGESLRRRHADEPATDESHAADAPEHAPAAG
ncbi:MMPL family transporter [Actinospica durhamensis]|uniref:MMPL family transporter n=1 Tax=Actinospica durhamensis TaxID=1508375 RepID=A0A941EMY0_9ACTN|nr:MMPL family transporter [Actinospica durhamensis]MBR7834226.1 MMPL family transporter [Actinospica durhamensis]